MTFNEDEDDSRYYFIYLDQHSDVPPDVRHVRISDSITKIPEDAFLNCRELETVCLPSEGLVEIGAYAFYGCASLRLVKNWPPSLKVIGGYAFYECTSLVSFPPTSSLREIGDYAFFGCVSLTTVRIRFCDALLQDDSNDKNEEAQEEIQGGIGNDDADLLREIIRQESRQESFYSATDSHSGDRIISNDDEESEQVAFEDDDNETPNDNEDEDKAEDDQHPVEIKEDKECDNMPEDDDSSQKTATESRLGEWVFGECTSLTHVELLGDISRILSGTFYGCNELLYVQMNVEAIGELAFGACYQLRLLELPPSTLIATSAFDNCKLLKTKVDDCNEDGIASFWKNRFVNLPIHAMCYQQQNQQKRSLQQEWSRMKYNYDENIDGEDDGEENEETAFEQKDNFGLNPLHILIMIATRLGSKSREDIEVLDVKSEDAELEGPESKDAQDVEDEPSSDKSENHSSTSNEETAEIFLLIEWLVKNYPSLLEKSDDCGLLPIHYAIYLAKNGDNHLKIIKILLENWKSFPDRARRIKSKPALPASLLLYALKQNEPPPMVTLVYLYSGEPLSPDILLLSTDSGIQELTPQQKLSLLILLESIQLQYLQHCITQSTESKSWLTPYLQHGWVQFVKMDDGDILSPILNKFLWNDCLDSSMLENYKSVRDLCQQEIRDILHHDASRLHQLGFAHDHCGRRALSVRGAKISNGLRKRLLWMGRYQIVRLLYQSAGTIVLEAKDYKMQDYCKNQWDHYFSTINDSEDDEEAKLDNKNLLGRYDFHQILLQMAVIKNGENDDIVNSLFQQAIASQENRQSLTLEEFTDFVLSEFSEDQSTVALKFTKHDIPNYDYLIGRGVKGERLDANHIVTTIQSSSLDISYQKEDLNAFLLSRNIHPPDMAYKFYHVLPLGIPIANIGAMVRSRMKEVGEAILHLHEDHGIYHNALTHQRVLVFKHFITNTSSVRLLMDWNTTTFDDNDASVPNMMSSRVIPPPEFIYCLDNLETYSQYKEYYGDDSSDAIKWSKKSKKGYVLKRFHNKTQEDDGDETPSPYEPINAASPILDIWSFGLLTYRLATGHDLFLHDMLEEVHIWGTEEGVAKRRLHEIPNHQLREFLGWVLHPSVRPQSMRDVLNHEYFSQDQESNGEEDETALHHHQTKAALEIMLRKMQPTIFFNTMGVSYVNNQQIRWKMEHSISTRLMRMTLMFDEAYEGDDGDDSEEEKAIYSTVPTCFVLLPSIISEEADKEGVDDSIDESEEAQGSGALMKYVQNMLDFMTEWIMEPKSEILESVKTMMLALLSSSEIQSFQFHLIDELTLRPANNDESSNYPLGIEPDEGVAVLFPIMTRVFQLLSTLDAIEDSSDLIKMFVPCKEDEVVFLFPTEVLKKAENFIQISKEIELVGNINSAWQDYCHWIQENDPKFTFSQLCRVVDKYNSNNTCAVWTSLDNAKHLQTEDEPPVMAFLRQQVEYFETKYHEAAQERDEINKKLEKTAGQRDAARQALVKTRIEGNDAKKKLEETQKALQETRETAQAATSQQRKAQTELENAYKNLSDTRNQLKDTARKLLSGGHFVPKKKKKSTGS